MNEVLPCSIDPAPGWASEVRWDPAAESRFLAVLSPDRGALLRLSTFDVEEARMDAVTWLEMAAEVHRPRGKPVEAVRCGEFAGYRTAFAAGDGRWVRGWVLRAGLVPLDITYTCAEADRNRDDSAVDAMLTTLRMRHASV
jgi:hypothetical protein